MYADIVAFMAAANLEQHEAELLDVIAWAEQSRTTQGFGYAKDTPGAIAWDFGNREDLQLLVTAALDLDVDDALIQGLKQALISRE